MLRNENADRTENAEAADPIEANEPTLPIESTEPVLPIDRIERAGIPVTFREHVLELIVAIMAVGSQ